MLVIDDDDTTHNILTRQLSKNGYRIVSACDGETGLRLARKLRPLAIILDIMMPGVDDWTVLTRLKADDDLAGVPVIVLSIVTDQQLGHSLGASDYLTQPIQRERLMTILNKYRVEHATCLVVDDDPTLRLLVRRTLEREGWHVVEARHGREALAEMARQIPDLILLDLMMPVMDGFEFLIELRRNSTWQTIPVIVTTTLELSPEDQAQLSGCVENVLQKGAYDLSELLQEVSKTVARSV